MNKREGEPQTLDLTGYRCPVPVIRLEAALRCAPPGAQFQVRADDPIAAVDIPHFCREAGHSIEKQSAPPGICVFLVTRGKELEPESTSAGEISP